MNIYPLLPFDTFLRYTTTFHICHNKAIFLHLDYPVKPDNDKEEERQPDNDSRGRKKHCRCLEFFATRQKIGMTIMTAQK